MGFLISSIKTLLQASVLSLFILGKDATLVHAETIEVGALPSPVGWTEGVCYAPITGAQVGDELEFVLTAHNVYKMASQSDYDNCNFDTAELLAEAGSGLYTYTITEEDARVGSIYLACAVGAHCLGNQKVRVVVDQVPILGARQPPTSSYLLGLSDSECLTLQYVTDGSATDAFDQTFEVDSVCSEPIKQEDGSYYVSCLSPPATLTPGGIINEARILHYPYPKDRRVRFGLRTWEFVAGDPGPDGISGVTAVPINQLYVHHLSGSVILGQGTEGIRQSAPDAEFPEPYGLLSGEEGDLMIFHIIDLRNVTDWLDCIECRCRDGNGTYLDVSTTNEFGVTTTGGVDCCTNCTTATGPTIDYRMRYNVSYFDIEEDEPVTNVLMLTADISPAVGKNIEFDVPQFQDIPESQIKPDNPVIQRLERVGPFNTLFKHDFFGKDYHGPETVRILRCVGHLHVAAVGMWLEDMTTGQTICAGIGQYGTDPEEDKGFLNAITVDTFEVPKEIPADRLVRLVTEYDATILHTGVMGMWFLFASSEEEVTKEEAALTVDVCILPSCDYDVLPTEDSLTIEEKECVDELPNSPICKFGNVCDCEDFVNAPESTGCNGVYTSAMGEVKINSVCNLYCGCPPPESSGCEDTLASTPSCTFGGLCECEDFVNAPESTGCGGKYSSDFGDIMINDVCPSYCGACPDDSTVQTEAILKQIEDKLGETCHFATSECQFLLSNLYTCSILFENDQSAASPSVRQQDSGFDQIKTVVRDNGRRLALEYAKLGRGSIHVGQEEQEITACTPEEEDADGSLRLPDDENLDDEDDSAGETLPLSFVFMLLISTAFSQLV